MLKEVPIPEPTDDEVLIRVLYWSVDPYMRIQQSGKDTWEEPHPLNVVQGGGTVGEVVKCGAGVTDELLQPGCVVGAYTGWQTYATLKAADARPLAELHKAGVPYSYALGVLGMPGRTAFFGLLEGGRLKSDDVVVVSGAAGAVGSIVCQVAKLSGCRVVGIAGSDEKCRVLTEDLGVDAAVNYKNHGKDSDSLAAALKEASGGDGFDVFFDNTGGWINDAILPIMRTFGRIVICGQITQYNGGLDAPELGPRLLHHVLYQRLTIQGVLARDFTSRMDEMLKQMVPWVRDGQLKFKETVKEGFDALPAALNSLFHGANTGKLVVKA